MNGARDASEYSPPPRVSVAIFNYNQGRFLAECYDGLAAQSFEPSEVFLVDDGSSDGSIDFIRESARRFPNCEVVLDGKNMGYPDRIRQVVNMASGEWLAILSGDDFFLPGGLATLVAATTPDVDVVWGNLRVIDEDGESLGYSRPRDTWQGPTARKYLTPQRPNNDIVQVNNFINGTTPLVRRSAVLEVGNYPEGVRPEDLNMWLTLGAKSKFAYVDSDVGCYRVVPGSGSRNEPFAMRNQAIVARNQLALGNVPRNGIARLIAMRWWLSFARTRGRPPFGVPEYARLAGLQPQEVLRQLPRAGFDPIWLSALAWIKRVGRGA